MIDNEIIIPLKCLVMNESDCSHCKLKDKNDKCQKFLYSDVLGLIDENNRQKAEIERLNNCVMSEEQVVKIIQEDIDRNFKKRLLDDYKILVDSFYKRVLELSCDDYSRKAILNTLRLALQDAQGQDVKSLKAEAVKEFAERLCEDWRKDEDEMLCDVDIVKWILDTYKEMVGENNG